MSILSIPCALRNLRLQRRKLAGSACQRFIHLPDYRVAIEQPDALAWAALWQRLPQPVNPLRGNLCA
ncbi:hypothetical protein [Aeromonas sp. 1HA1]|jgi:hypothetical protein|nr:hypothetical protein [Aeromonas sp. 1HA1]MDF2413930.1 hypothetical protein [Aeromonas sp. 1HA1]